MLASEVVEALKGLIAELGDQEVQVPLQGAPFGIVAPVKSLKIRGNKAKNPKTEFIYVIGTK